MLTGTVIRVATESNVGGCLSYPLAHKCIIKQCAKNRVECVDPRYRVERATEPSPETMPAPDKMDRDDPSAAISKPQVRHSANVSVVQHPKYNNKSQQELANATEFNRGSTKLQRLSGVS